MLIKRMSSSSNSKTLKTLKPENLSPAYIFIDGSYYIFYRFYATMRWWKITYPETLVENIDFEPIHQPLFMDNFQRLFVSKLQEIPFRVGATKNTRLFVAKDCPKQDIWRKSIYPEYKQTRVPDKMLAGIFHYVYSHQLFELAGISPSHILELPTLEADDCISLYIKKINDKQSQPSKNWLQSLAPQKILIFASDHDYLQLCNKHIKVINMSYKMIEPQKNALLYKIILGDKSDNISSIFPKCGTKTAMKYMNDESLFTKKLHSAEEYVQKYHRNRLLVDFNQIPEHLQTQFFENYFP